MAAHGTATRYMRGCRCDECRAANTAKCRDYKERRALGQIPTHADIFWATVTKDTAEGCWLRDGVRGRPDGYTRVLNQKVPAHRYAYELLVGPIPEGMELDHICHDPDRCAGGVTCLHRRCVNPAHLEVVTRKENGRRSGSLWARNARKTHCSNGHPYAGDNLRITPQGHRDCRACHRDRERQARRWRVRGQASKERRSA